jgi:UDP-N-acetylmuramoylalanine--D-glutamate ligase
MFVGQFGSRMIAVTGSKGKSTTSALIAHLLSAHGLSVSWGGNMGIPLWDVEPADWVVAEVSSYQCSALTSSPRIAVVTSLFEEHLDWHGSAEQYFADKLRLVAGGPEKTIIGGQSPTLVDQLERNYPGLDCVTVGQDGDWAIAEREGMWSVTRGGHHVIACSRLPVTGHHNWWNVAIALEAAASVVEMSLETVVEALVSFRPLPHRLEPIDDPSGVVFINDSLATNPQASAMALQAFRDRRVIVLLGGADRGVDKAPLRQEIIAHPPAVVLGLPASGPDLLEQIGAWCGEAGISAPKCVPVSGMVEAVTLARKLAQPGDVVVMSPGAPSFGHYRDYEHRAEDFRRAITETR